MTTTDRTTEPAGVFDAHLARWEAAEADPDGTVERVARALAEHEPRYRSGYLTGEPDWIECGQADAEVATCSWRSDPEADAQDTAAAHHRHVAAAAIAALRPAPDAPRVESGAAVVPCAAMIFPSYSDRWMPCPGLIRRGHCTVHGAQHDAANGLLKDAAS